MIYGVGIDMIEIDRIRKAINDKGKRFLTRVFTAQEIARCQKKSEKYQYFGGHFAAKEAVMKALGTGRRPSPLARDTSLRRGILNEVKGKGVRWVDIEVIYNQDGKPDIKLHGRAEAIAKSLGIADIHVSISHIKEYAIAQAVAMKE